MKKRLDMGFRDEDGKKYSLSLDSPRQDLEGQEVKEAMELIVARDLFKIKDKSLVALDMARIVKTQVEEVELG